MKKRLIPAIVAVCFSLIGSAQTAQPSKDIDKMVAITNLDYDMGNIPSHKPLEFNVTIKNIGRDTVTLKEVKAGCGCTTPKYRGGEKIAPGKSTYITLGFNGDAVGGFAKTADIFFNDGSLTKQVKFHGVAVMDSSAVSKPAVNR